MAPRSSGKPNEATEEPLQLKVSALDKSELPLQQKLQEAQAILKWNKPHSFRDGQLDSSYSDIDVPLPILKWLFRWLIKQLDEVCSEEIPLSVQTEFWKGFTSVISQLPSRVIAQSLKNGQLLPYLDKTVQLCLQYASENGLSSPQLQPSDSVLDDISSWSKTHSISISSPLKRKRGQDNATLPIDSASQPNTKSSEPLGSTLTLFYEVCKLLQQLVARSEASAEALPTCDEEFVREIFPQHSQAAAPLFSNALHFIRLLQNGKHRSDVGDGHHQNIDALLRPFLFFWSASGTVGQDTEAEQARIFCTKCLPDVISLLAVLRRGNDSAACQQLEDLVNRMTIIPARRRYLTVKKPKEKLQDTSFLVEYFDCLVEGAAPDEAFDKNERSIVLEPLAILYDLALRKLPDNTALRVPADEDWLCVLFEHLGLVSAEKSGKVWHTTIRELLRLAKQKSLRLSTSTLETIIERILQQGDKDGLDIENWDVVGLCISLDQSLALTRSNSGVTDIVQSLLIRTVSVTDQSMPSLHGLPTPENSHLRAPVDHFILPLLQCHVQSRQFDKFLSCWHTQLSVARHQLNQRANSEVHSDVGEEGSTLSSKWNKSVWEDAAIISAVRSYAPLAPQQLVETVSELSKDLLSPRDEIDDSPLYSSCLILYALLGSHFSEAAINLLEDSVQDVRDKIAKSLHRTQTLRPCNALMWDVLSVIVEQWPQLYQEWKPKHRLQIIDLAKTVIQDQPRTPDGRSFDESLPADVAFAAFAFLWRRASIQLDSAEGAGTDNLDLTNEVAAAVSELGALEPASRGEGHDQKKRLAEAYMTILTRNALPFFYVQESSREKQLGPLTSHVVRRAAYDNVEVNSATIAGDRLTSNDSARSWLTHEGFEGSTILMSDVQRTSMNLALGNIERNEDIEASWTLGSLDPASWSKRERRAIQEGLIEAILKWKHERDTFPQGLISLLAHYMKTPLSASDELHLKLRVLLEKELSSIIEKPTMDAEETGAAEGLRRILGHQSDTTTKPASHLKATITSFSSMQAAGRAFATFKDSFELADAVEKEQAIQELWKTCTTEASLPLLIFARKVCGAKYPKEQQTPEVKTAFQELLSQLFVIALESRDMRRVLLALRAVTVAFAKNSWAIGQTHIDLCLACASQIPTKRGCRATKSVLVEAINDAPKVNGERRPRARLDLASARRMVFGSLAVRNPKTKDDELKVRQQLEGRSRAPAPNGVNGTPSKEPVPPTEEDPEEQLDPELPSALYSALCSLLGATLRSFRARTGGRWHLLIDALRGLLPCLFTPYTTLEGDEMPWLTGSELTAGNGAEFARLLTLLCDPTASSVQGSKRRDEHAAALHDATRRARRAAGENMPPLIKEYCVQRLHGQLDPDTRAALVPGLYAAFDAIGMAPDQAVVRVLNESLARQEREIFRATWDEYLRFGKWQGG